MIYLEWNPDKTDYSVWDADRIRSAFRDGHGTLDDFKRYMRENRHVCFEAVEVPPCSGNRIGQAGDGGAD